jgi:hypothetical protein
MMQRMTPEHQDRRIPRNLVVVVLAFGLLSLGWGFGRSSKLVDVFGGVRDVTVRDAISGCSADGAQALAGVSIDLVRNEGDNSTVLASAKTDARGDFSFRQTITKAILVAIEEHPDQFQLVLSKKPYFENLVEPKVGRYLTTKVTTDMPRIRYTMDGAWQVTIVSSSDTSPLLDRLWVQLHADDGTVVEKEGLVDTKGMCRILFPNLKPGKYRIYAQSYNFTPFFGNFETICPGVTTGYNAEAQAALAYRMNPNFSNSAEVDTLSVGATLKIPPIEN